MTDFEIDGDVLEGLNGVKSDDAKNAAAKEPDRKHVIISLLRGINKTINSHVGAKYAFENVENPSIYEVSEYFEGKSVRDEGVLEILTEHVKKYGTIDEVIIVGHGETRRMSSKSLLTLFDDEENKIGIPFMIHGLDKAGKGINQKITERIVFDGCRTFAELDDKGVQYYREYAEKYQLQIVGTTSSLFSGYGSHVARYIQFTPKGEVIRDKLDSRYHPLAIIGNTLEWTDCFLNKTQEEGEKLWKEKELMEKAERKRTELSSKSPSSGPKF